MQAITGAVVNDEQAQVASFIGTHVRELAPLAKRAGLNTLCFLLEIAALEASTVAGEWDAADLEQDCGGS